MKKNFGGQERSVEILKKMQIMNCGLKLKSKQESLEFMLEQYEHYVNEGKKNEAPVKLLKEMIDASVKH